MAEKGARTQLEPVARQMYIDGQSLTAIEAALDVSRQTLAAWKGSTKKPSENTDEWDKARTRKANFALRMEALLERELTFAEEREPGALGGASIDSLTKLGSLVVKFRLEEARKQTIAEAADRAEDSAKQAGVSEETMKKIRRDVLKMAQ